MIPREFGDGSINSNLCLGENESYSGKKMTLIYIYEQNTEIFMQLMIIFFIWSTILVSLFFARIFDPKLFLIELISDSEIL
jgi:hypothetical protein